MVEHASRSSFRRGAVSWEAPVACVFMFVACFCGLRYGVFDYVKKQLTDPAEISRREKLLQREKPSWEDGKSPMEQMQERIRNSDGTFFPSSINNQTNNYYGNAGNSGMTYPVSGNSPGSGDSYRQQQP